jgi:uncharacterized protein YajQ (UPF0234 family)
MTDNKIQFLTDNQINGILDIVRRDYINPQVTAKLLEIENSYEFKMEYEKIKNSEETQKEYADALTTKENNLKLVSLLEQVKLIKEDYTIGIKNGYCEDFYEVSLTSIEDDYKYEVTSIENRIRSSVYDTLKLNSYDNFIVNQVINELRTRLQLTSPADLQTIIDSIIPFINVDKYIKVRD